MEKSTTIRDVAAAAGVSIGTVSRALKNQPGLSAQTRSEVLQAAERLGYDVSKLRGAKPRRMLFLFNRAHASLSANPFYSIVLQGVEQACHDEGVSLSLLSVGAGEPVDTYIRRHEPDVLLAAGYFESELLARIKGCDLPVVLVDHYDAACFSVNDDNVQGAWLATRHLIERGAKRVAMIVGPLAHHSVGLRVRGYRKALFEAGLLADPDLEVTLDAGLPYDEAARRAMQQLLSLKQRPDAVFAYNDETALNAMQACRDAGLSLPRDMAFAGYDDIAMAASSQPALTTISVDKEALGRQAAEQLIQGHAPVGERLLPVELVVRQSSVRG